MNDNIIFDLFRIMFIFMIILLLLLLASCTKTTNINYHQTNYGEECLYEPYTNTYKDLLFCYQLNMNKEHIQNDLTNELENK